MSILNVLNRQSQKKQVDEKKEQEEKKRGLWIVRNIKWIMFLFFNLVALVFDGLAVTTVYALTNGNILLTFLSLLPTGIPMFMWEGGWLYPLADKSQKKKAIFGIVLSVVSALIVGSLAIVATLDTNPNTRFYVSTALLIWCVLVVITHGILAAFYFYKDPIIMREHELQVTKADNDYQRETMQEAETLLRDAEKILSTEQRLKQTFGEKEVNKALEILLGVDLNGDGKIGDKPMRQAPVMAQQVKQEELQEKDPTNRRP